MHIIKYPEKGRFSPRGVVSLWRKKENDIVKKGDILLDIEAAGELLEVESAAEGHLLKILEDAGRVIKAGQRLAVIGKPGENISSVIAAQGEKKVTGEPEKPQKEVPAAVKPAAPVQVQKSPEIKKEDAMTSNTNSSDSVIPILMPQAGQSMEEGTILSWKIKEGDRIEVGQIIMEIETDKATMEVEAVNAGRVAKIVAQAGTVVPVKVPIAYLAEEGVNIDAQGSSEPASASQVSAPAASKAAAVVSAEGITPVLMPQAGQSMEEGTIVSWKVKEGDRIEVGQIIMEIETDKATMEVEAVDAGRIAKIVAQAGAVVPVKVPVAYLAEESVNIDMYLASAGAVPTESPKQTAAAPKVSASKSSASAAPKAAAVVSETGRVKASPAARKAAESKGISLASIGTGSGPGGRIISTDVENADVIPTETQVRPVSKMRRAIANNLTYSKQNVPHFYAKTTIDAGKLFSTYRKTKEQFKCSVNDFVVRACAKAIRQYPAFRGQYQPTGIIENPSVNIGIAVGIEDGLTVPVVLNADRMNLQQLAEKTRQVAEAARNGKVEGVGQGVFTITNLGMYGIEEFSAIINPPESAILAVGAVREGVVVENGAIRATRLMTVTLSADHRIIDGLLGAQFLKTLKELLEAPEDLIK